jgi:hypothetical protein
MTRAARSKDSVAIDASRPSLKVGAAEFATREPIRAAKSMPAEMRQLLQPEAGLYVRSNHNSKIKLTETPVNKYWSRVSLSGGGSPPLTGLPGAAQVFERKPSKTPPVRRLATEPQRPAWLDLEFMPRLLPFKQARAAALEIGRAYVEPVTMYRMSGTRDEALRFVYPWCTIGQVLVGHNLGTQLWSGSGVLVGRNLLLTASHIAPWNRGPGQWWMRFVPGRRITDEPHGSSFVESFFGTYSDPNDFEASGKDYVICKLYTPLGAALGWMGSRSFGSESDYYNRRFISVGYPGYFGDKPAVDFDIDIDDIDSDSPGLELETTFWGAPQGDGWSGGPLWMWENEKPYVVGVLSGNEKDELDPRRYVWGAGGLLVDRVKHGINNWS